MSRWVLLTAALMVWVSMPVGADDSTAKEATKTPETEAPVPASVRSLPPQQPGDDRLTPLEAAQPRTPDDQRRLDALAHYMAGELHLQRGGDEALDKALGELSQSIELNPQAIEPYRLYIPAAVRQGDDAGAQKYALLATEHTSEGIQLLRALVAVYVQQGQVPRAVEALEASQKIEGLAAKSFARLILNRHLGQCYSLQNQGDKAAETYAQLLAALRPEPDTLTDDERLQLFGERGELYEDIGNALLAAKRPEQAVEAYQISAEKHGRSPGLHSFNLAQVFHQTGKPERAVEELEKYFAAHHAEKGRAPYQLYKDLLKEMGRDAEFFPKLKTLAGQDQKNKFLHHFLASELVAQGELDAAEKIYTEMGGQSDPEALVGLASIYRRQGKFEPWVTTAGRAFVVLQLNNPAVRERLNQEYKEMGERFEQDLKDLAKNQEQLDGVVKVGREKSIGNDPSLELEPAWLLGRLAIEAKRVDDAAHFYNYAIGTQNVPSYDLFRELGAFYIDQEKYPEAEKTFQTAADHPALEPLRFFFLSLVSVAREMDGRIEEAIAAIKETRRLAPNESQFAVQEARIYYRARRWDEAIEIFESILRDFRDDEETLRECRFSLSAVLVQKGDFDRGEQILLDILAKEPDHPQANNDLGYLWADRDKNLEQAKAMVTKALAAEPENAAYMDSMGWVLYRLGEYDEAAKHLEKASAEPRGEDSTIFDHLGDVQAKRGEQEKATAAWKRALELEEEKPAPDPKMLEALKRKLPTEEQPRP